MANGQWKNRIVGSDEVAPDDLLANPLNWRVHPKHQQDALKGVIDEVGFVSPVLVQAGTDVVVDGHMRVTLALRDNIATIPVIYLDLDDNEVNTILATFDPISALAATDAAQLDALLREVSTSDAAVMQMLADLAEEAGVVSFDGENEGLTDADEVPEPPVDPITRPGDLWTLGRHRLLCGDSTNRADVDRLMQGERADMVFTSPPYAEQRTYQGNLHPWDELMNGAFSILPTTDAAQVLVNLGLVHRDGEWVPYWERWLGFMKEHAWRRFGWYVWDQGSGLPGDWNGRLAPSHEFVFHFNRESVSANKTVKTKLGGQKKTGSGLRQKDGVVTQWNHAGRLVQPTKVPDSVLRINRHSTFTEAVDHPAVFPVALADLVIETFSKQGDILFEPFGGGGTTVISAEQKGRQCYTMEIAPVYCDVIVRRWEQFTGETASREAAL